VPTLIKMMMKERRGVSFYVESSFSLYQIGKPAADLLVPTAEGQDKEILKWRKRTRSSSRGVRKGDAGAGGPA